MTDPIELPYPRPEGPHPPRRPRGGQHGDHNAFKHCFYVRAFPSSEIKEFGTHTFQGIQEEIAALRLLNCRAIERASLHVQDDVAFHDDGRVVIGLTVALNATLRTQVELDLHGGSEFDNELKHALEAVRKELCIDPVES